MNNKIKITPKGVVKIGLLSYSVVTLGNVSWNAYQSSQQEEIRKEAKERFEKAYLTTDEETFYLDDDMYVIIDDDNINICERAVTLETDYPKLEEYGYLIYEGIDEIPDEKWDYIFRLKSDKLKTVNRDFDGIISIDSGSTYKNYFVVKDYSYNEYKFNIIRFIEQVKNKDDKIFTFITSLSVTDNNIKKLIDMGRRRWKIENNGFNNQKNILFDITHMCSLDYNAMKVHYLFIQFAHTIRQLLDFGSNLVESFQGKLKEISFAILNELISSHVNVSLNSNFQLRFDKLII